MKNDPSSSRSIRRSAGVHSFLTLAIFGFILVMINYLGFKYYSHKDLTSSQFYTLSAKTKDVLGKLDSPVTVYTFLDERNPALEDQVTTLLKEYQRAGGKNFSYEKIDAAYNSNRANELYKKLHFDANDHLLILEYKDRPPRFVKEDDMYDTNPVTQQMGAFKGEQKITGALVGLIEGKPAKVYFTAGHGEHPIQNTDAPQGYGLLGQALTSENVELDTLNLAQKSDVPADADAVVIAGPSIAFSPVEVEALQKYIDQNGKLYILIDPYVSLGLDDLLKQYGLKYEDDLVLYRAIVSGTPSTIPLALIYQGGFAHQPVTEKLAAAGLQLIIQSARSITLLTDDKGQPNPKTQFLLQTDADAWGWPTAVKPGTPQPDLKTLSYNKLTDSPGPVTVSAAYDGGTVTDPTTKATVPATRIIVVGSSKFVENDSAESVGLNFVANGIDWLVKKDAVLDISPKTPQEYGVNLSPMQFNTVWTCTLFIIPGIALGFGLFTWFSRRK